MNKKQTRTLLIFYVLSCYVFLQFVWWAYYLVDLNGTILELRLNPSSDSLGEADLKSIHRKKTWMILGEGAVFVLFLGLGIWKVQSNLRKESRLALLQQNFLLSVTHEIKSPIASIKLYLETLLKRQLDESRQKAILSSALQDSDRLDLLSDKILLAARIESRSEAFNLVRLNISDEVRSFSSHLARALGKNHKTEFDIEDGLYIKADAQAIQSILGNLYENAVKYSAAGSSIHINLKAKENKACLTVADEGPGIPNSEKPRIFEKFYRPGDENTRTAKGTGLGLYIVSELAQVLDASLSVQDNHPKGTKMIVKLNLL